MSFSLERFNTWITRKSIEHSASIHAENIYAPILVPGSNIATIGRLRKYYDGRHSDITLATLRPNEPLVSISPILFNELESHTTTLPSYVVEYNMDPSGESDSAHVSPTMSLRSEVSVPGESDYQIGM